MPAASRSSTAAGGVLVMNVNVRSSKTVISTGMIVPDLGLRARVERLAELHDVDAVLAQGGADRRRRVGGAGGDLQLDECQDLLGHGVLASGYLVSLSS